MLKLAEDGVSVTFISSEIEEMLRTCSRLIVMRDRAIVGRAHRREFDGKRCHARDCPGGRVSMVRMKAHGSHLFLPLSVLAILIVINLIKGADYFSISMINGALYGNIPNILFGASELVILAIGMTLVTSSSGGQDISVGVAAAITSAVFVRVLLSAGGITWLTILAAFLVSCVVGIVIGALQRLPGLDIQRSANGRDTHTVYRGEIHSISDRWQTISHTGERPHKSNRQRNTGNPHTNADNPDRHLHRVVCSPPKNHESQALLPVRGNQPKSCASQRYQPGEDKVLDLHDSRRLYGRRGFYRRYQGGSP